MYQPGLPSSQVRWSVEDGNQPEGSKEVERASECVGSASPWNVSGGPPSNPPSPPPSQESGEREVGSPQQERLERLEAPPRVFPVTGGEPRSPHHRPVCLSHQPSATTILQLKTRPRHGGYRRPLNSLEGTPRIRVPPVCADPPVSTEAGGGESQGHPCSPSVGQSAMVPTVTEVSDQPANSPTNDTGDHPGSRRTPPSVGGGGPLAISRLACVRRSYAVEGLSDGVISIIRSSWRGSTEAAYTSAWGLWSSWCAGLAIDPFSAPLRHVLEFLYDQFELGKQYRTINSLRSAISMTHHEVDGVRVGQHPIVSRFLKGIFNSRPPAPRYSVTWDVDVVLQYLRGLPQNEDLSFQALSHMVAMLMALANADRCSDLASLDLDYMQYQVNGVKFVIPGLTKTRRSGPPLEAFYPAFPDEPQLCPVKALQCYQAQSADLRVPREAERETNPLFVAVRSPHKPVKAATIGHWLKRVMEAAGVDTKVFTAHSTRGASTSKAHKVGVGTADILQAANWSSVSTFCRFYCRPIFHSQCGLGVLRQQGHMDKWYALNNTM